MVILLAFLLESCAFAEWFSAGKNSNRSVLVGIAAAGLYAGLLSLLGGVLSW